MLGKRIEEYHNRIISFGPRASGSLKEFELAQYIKGVLDESGLDTEIEIFPAASHNAVKSSIRDFRGGKYVSLPSMFSSEGTAGGSLIFLGSCRTPAVSLEDLKGKIGLLNPYGADISERIECIKKYEEAGLVGLIVFSPYMDSIDTKSIRFPEIKRMITLAVSWRTANELKRIEGEGIFVSVEHGLGNREESVNLIAVLKGRGRKWITVSAHMDTAPFTVGANDNASGCALLLELAVQAASNKFDASIYFLFSGSEENGGSDTVGRGAENFYSRRHSSLKDCIAHIEIDDVGNTLCPHEILFGGNTTFRRVISECTAGSHVHLIEDNNPWCDHGAALKYSIPYLFVTNSLCPRPIYHTPDDGLEYFDVDMLIKIFPVVKKLLNSYASSEPFFPYVEGNGILIRPARYSDFDDIKQITELAFEPVSKDRMAEEYFNEYIGNKKWFEYKNSALIDQCRENIYHVIVCEIDGRVVGYATMTLDFERGIAEIENNAVHPDFQGRGIGKAMQAEIRRRMKEDGFTKFTVSTLSHDLAAQRVYEKIGYEKYSESYHYFMNLIEE